MSNQDNVIINTRERPLSSDINNIESFAARSLAEALLYSYSSGNAATGVAASRNVVLGGLAVIPNGNDVDVTAGLLMQDSASLSPTPGTYDSNYRYGRNASSTTVTMPSPVSDTFYVVEAQVSAVITSTQSRDILDTGTGVFVPANVPKIQEFQLTFQLVAGSGGGNIPAPSGGNWVPLAIVKRPGGGGAVSANDICDARNLWNALPSHRQVTSPGDVLLAAQRDASDVTLRTYMPHQQQGAGVVYVELDAVDVSSATYIDPGVTLAANTLYHLYLCAWNGLTPTNQDFAGTTNQRGILVLSDVDPVAADYGASIASGTVDLPAPWASTVAGSACVYIGSLFRNNANTGWAGQWTIGARQQRCLQLNPAISVPSGAAPQNLALNLTGLVPPVARAVLLRVDAPESTVSGTTYRVLDAGGTDIYDEVLVNSIATSSLSTTIYLSVPVAVLGMTSTIRRSSGTTAAASPVYVVGWTL